MAQGIADLMRGIVRPAASGRGPETCCGIPMDWQEVLGVRRYQCRHRGHHPAIYVNLNTGERISDENLPWLGGEYDPS